jgi:hypothetical protein
VREAGAHLGEALTHLLAQRNEAIVHAAIPSIVAPDRQDVSRARHYSRVAVNGQIWLYAQ